MSRIIHSSYFVLYPTTKHLADASKLYEDRCPRANKAGEIVHFAGTLVVPILQDGASQIPVVGDKWRFISVPKGARLKSWNAEHGDLDTDGSPALAIDFGWETSDPDCFEDGVTTKYQSADATAAGNSLTENTTETVFDAITTTAEDYLTMTVAVAPTALSAAVTITFRGSYYTVSR